MWLPLLGQARVGLQRPGSRSVPSRRGTGPVVPLPGWAEPTEADPAGGEGGRAAREAAHGWAEPTEADPAGGEGGRAARVRVDRAVLSVVCSFMASRLVGLSES